MSPAASDSSPILYIVNDKDEVQSVVLSLELWLQVEKTVTAAADKLTGKAEPPAPPEPMGDLDQLLQFWDFPYPYSREVECGQCGAKTADWQADDPRLFRLKACNLGGLTAFECQKCRARVSRRHFKDRVQSETTPWVDK